MNQQHLSYFVVASASLSAAAASSCELMAHAQVRTVVFERDQLSISLEDAQEQLDRQMQYMDTLEVRACVCMCARARTNILMHTCMFVCMRIRTYGLCSCAHECAGRCASRAHL